MMQRVQMQNHGSATPTQLQGSNEQFFSFQLNLQHEGDTLMNLMRLLGEAFLLM